VSVPGDEIRHVTGDGRFEELVVVGIGFDRGDLLFRIDKLSEMSNRFDLLLYFTSHCLALRGPVG